MVDKFEHLLTLAISFAVYACIDKLLPERMQVDFTRWTAPMVLLVMAGIEYYFR